MKRVLSVLLAGFLFSTPVMAQISGFSQRGKVTQELQADGLYIAHPSIPLFSKVLVVNTTTGKEVEATVIRRIPASANRIADLSPSTWNELRLTPDTDVRIYNTASPKPRPVEQVAQADPLPDPDPKSVTINNYYITNNEQQEKTPVAEAEPPPVEENPDSEIMPQLAAIILDSVKAREAREAREIEEARLAREARELEEARLAREAREREEARLAREARELEEARLAKEAREREEARLAREREAANTPAPAPASPPQAALPQPVLRGELKIIPGLPDPNNGRIYNLQVGAYSGSQSALEMASKLRSNGFDVAQEWSGSVYRVIVRDIPASMVYYAAQRLGAMGIGEIWIRER